MLLFVNEENFPGLITDIEGSDFTKEEAKSIILKLLGDNRRLVRCLKKYRLCSTQHIKLVYVIEEILCDQMAEEQLSRTCDIQECLTKVKKYLNITKKFVEKTEILLGQYEFQGENERQQLYSSVKEMGPITRICNRIQKQVDAKQPRGRRKGPRSNGTLPRTRTGSVSSAVENGEKPGNIRRYRKRKLSASRNYNREEPKVSRRYSTVESQDEQNGFNSNQQHRRPVPRSGLIKQRRRQKRVGQPETSDNESGRDTESRVSSTEEEELASEREDVVIQNHVAEWENSLTVNGEILQNASLGNESSIETEIRSQCIVAVRDILFDPAADNDPDVSKYKQKYMPKENSSKEDEETYAVVDEAGDDQAQSPDDNSSSDKDNQMDTADQAPGLLPKTFDEEDTVEKNVDSNRAPCDDDEEEEEEDHKGGHSNQDTDENYSTTNSPAGHSHGKGPHTPKSPDPTSTRGPRTPMGTPPASPRENAGVSDSEECKNDEGMQDD